MYEEIVSRGGVQREDDHALLTFINTVIEEGDEEGSEDDEHAATAEDDSNDEPEQAAPALVALVDDTVGYNPNRDGPRRQISIDENGTELFVSSECSELFLQDSLGKIDRVAVEESVFQCIPVDLVSDSKVQTGAAAKISAEELEIIKQNVKR